MNTNARRGTEPTQTVPSVEVHGEILPALGFGTWLLYGQEAADAVRDAIEIGYRHLDTARIYENEYSIGLGIHESGIARAELFLTTKIYASAYWSRSTQVRRVRRGGLRCAAEDSCMRLDTDYLDLLLLHWPSREVSLEETMEEMVQLKDEGVTRHIGVSNFPTGMLHQACELAPVFCNQVEYHPFLSQERLLDAARELGIAVVAHSPLARGKVFEDETLTRIGARHGKSAAQVALRWLVEQPNVCAVPTATTSQWRQDNWNIFDFALSSEDTAEIDALPKDVRIADGPFAPDWEA